MLLLQSTYAGVEQKMRDFKAHSERLLVVARQLTRIGEGMGITNFEKMQELILKLSYCPPDKCHGGPTFKTILGARFDDVWLVDTEFISMNGTRILTEIGMISLGGKTISLRVLPQEPLDKLEARLLENMSCSRTGYMGVRSFQKYFGKDRKNGAIPLKDAIALIQEEGFGPHSIVVEWSTTFCDWKLLNTSASSVGLGQNMPPRENATTILFAFKALLPGLFSMSLPTLYPLFYDDEYQHHSHRASVDAFKMAKMLDVYLRIVDVPNKACLQDALARAIELASAKKMY